MTLYSTFQKSERKRRAEEFEKHLNFLNIIVGKLKKEKGKLETILILQKQKVIKKVN